MGSDSPTLESVNVTPGSRSDELAERFRAVRRASESLCASLEPEDFCIQSMPDVSPTKWHLAHTTWFFETFVLKRSRPGYRSPHPQYEVLFNSYYNAIGEQHPRAERGLLSRPTVKEVFQYRAAVDDAMENLLAVADNDRTELSGDLLDTIETGLHHDQQHQELMLMDIQHVFSRNPLFPAYRESETRSVDDIPPLDWGSFDGGVHDVGHDGADFAFDNESPRHQVLLDDFQLADRLVTCGEYREFIEDGGYERPEFWLSDGWHAVRSGGWQAPLYWRRDAGDWQVFTLQGLQSLNPGEPVSHVSYFEADAFARWSGARLPTETEWETAARSVDLQGNFVEMGKLRPTVAAASNGATGLKQMFGDLWEWTSSPYVAYPGFKPLPNALGEYNGKFMCNQFVLRGGSFATPADHIRATYRNFFQPEKRWQFSGFRLARDAR